MKYLFYISVVYQVVQSKRNERDSITNYYALIISRYTYFQI